MQLQARKMNALTIALRQAVLVLVSSGCAACAANTCDLTRPPKEAGVNLNHGEFFFIYPARLDPGFTGCQTMWDERGQKSWIGRYEKGDPTALQIADESPQKMVSCRYMEGKLVEGQSDACPSGDALRRGLHSVSKASAPPVPAARDPRR